MKYLIILLLATSAQAQFTINYLQGNQPSANINAKSISFDSANPSEHDFGILTNAATAKFSQGTNCYALNASGQWLTFDLPASPQGAFRIEGIMTNSSPSNQIVKLTVGGTPTSLLRQGLSTNLLSVSSFTNVAKAYSRFIFFSSRGAWTDFIVVGDGL